MVTVAKILRKEVIRSREDADDEWGLNIYTERRSTHVFDDKDLQELSHKSLFSILSNSFQAKSPFRIKSSITATTIKSPVKTRNSDFDALDFAKATAIMSLSPSHVDPSEACHDDVHVSPTKRVVVTLPIKPPPLIHEDEGDDFAGLREEDVREGKEGLENHILKSEVVVLRRYGKGSKWNEIVKSAFA